MKEFRCCYQMIFLTTLGMLFALATVSRYGMTLEALCYTVFFVLLSGIALQDLDTRRISGRLLIGILPLGVVLLLRTPVSVWLEQCVGWLILGSCLALFVLLTKEGLGWGDVELMMASAFLLGVSCSFAGFFLAFLLCGITGLLLWLYRRRNARRFRQERIPFAPFLAVGLAVSFFY